MALKLATAFVELTLDQKRFLAGLARARAQLKTLAFGRMGAQPGIQAVGRAAKQVGPAISQRFSKGLAATQAKLTGLATGAGAFASIAARGFIALAAPIVGAVTAFASLEQGFSRLQAVTKLSDAEMLPLSNSIRRLGATTAGVSIGELQSIAVTAAQLGIEGTKNITAFTRTIAMVAATTDLSAEEAANALAQIMNVFNVLPTQASLMASVLVRVADASVASSSEILDLTRRMSGAATVLGLTWPQVFAVAGALKDAGVTAEVGGTAMSNFFIKMKKESGLFARAAGLNVKEFSDLVATDPIQAVQMFFAALAQMPEQKALKALDMLKLRGARVAGTLLQLRSAAGALGKHLGIANDEMGRGTAIEKRFEIFSRTLTNQLKLLWNNIMLLAEALAVPFITPLKSAITAVIGWTAALRAASPATLDLIAKLALGAAGMLLFAAVGGRIVQAIAKVGSALLLVAQNPLVLLVAGLLALAAALIIPSIAGESMGQKLSTVLDFLKEKWATFAAFVRPAISTLGFMFRNWSDIVQIVSIEIGTWLHNTWQHILALWTNTRTFLTWFFTNWKAVLVDVANFVLTIFRNIGRNIGEAFNGIVQFFKAFFSTDASSAESWLEGLAMRFEAAKKAFSEAFEPIGLLSDLPPGLAPPVPEGVRPELATADEQIKAIQHRIAARELEGQKAKQAAITGEQRVAAAESTGQKFLANMAQAAALARRDIAGKLPLTLGGLAPFEFKFIDYEQFGKQVQEAVTGKEDDGINIGEKQLNMQELIKGQTAQVAKNTGDILKDLKKGLGVGN